MRILFICTGNTCRSPMAQETARLLINKLGLEGFEAASAGLFAESGMHASAGAQAAVRLIGGDLSDHRARSVKADIVEDAELILCMTTSHKTLLLRRYPDAAGKVFTLLEYIDEPGDIADPFGGDAVVYEECLTQIGAAVRSVLESMRVSPDSSAQ